MANTIGTSTLASSARAKYFDITLQQVLRKALIAEAICEVDRSEVRYIHNPYSNQPTATINAGLVGTYSVSTFTVSEDTLTVGDEFIYAEHIYDFERWNSNFDLMAARIDEMSYAIAYSIDKYVVNALCEDGTGTYTTPIGGFTTASNIPIIMSNLIGMVMGYSDVFKGLFLVIENTDVTGFIQSGASQGFSYADAVLKNGWIGNYMGVDIYVVRTGTFVDATMGSLTFTNSGHRVFGVKKVATYCSPRGVQYEEKKVTEKTGREIVCYGYCGFKLWSQKASLVVDITLA